MRVRSQGRATAGAIFLAGALLNCSESVQPPPADQTKATNAALNDVRALAKAAAIVAAKTQAKTKADEDVASAQEAVAAATAANDPSALATAKLYLTYTLAKQALAIANLQNAMDEQDVAQKRSALDTVGASQKDAALTALEEATRKAGASAGKVQVAAADVAEAATKRAAILATSASQLTQAASASQAAADEAKKGDPKTLAAKKTQADVDATKAAKATSQASEANAEARAAASANAAGATAAGSPAPNETPAQQSQVEFATGGRLRYGLSVSLFEFDVERPNNQPARLREYQPNFQIVPPQIGFQFTYEPPQSPWRLKKSDGTDFQLVSVGGMLLVQVDNTSLAQGSIALGAAINFFANVVGIGLAVDLYRGVPTLGSNDSAGSTTAYTGLLAWALSPQGAVTPEDVSLVLTFGLEPIVSALSGVAK